MLFASFFLFCYVFVVFVLLPVRTTCGLATMEPEDIYIDADHRVGIGIWVRKAHTRTQRILYIGTFSCFFFQLNMIVDSVCFVSSIAPGFLCGCFINVWLALWSVKRAVLTEQ